MPIPAATAAPAVAPAPVPQPIAAPSPAPAAVPAPIPAARPETVVRPAPAPAAAPARREVAVAAPASAAPSAHLDAKTVEQIFSCLAPGLPAEWRRTWVEVTNTVGAPTAKFYYSTSSRREEGEEFTPCNPQEVTRRIASLSDAGGSWRSARLLIDNEGAYRLDYER